MKTLEQYITYKDSIFGKIPVNWKIERLGDLIYIKGRIGWRNLKKEEYVDEGYAIFTGRMFDDDELSWEKCERITKERYEESPEIILQKNDILVTKDGTIGKVVYVYELPEPATIAGHIFLIRSQSEKVLQRYLFYFFNSYFFKQLVKTRIEGSVVPALYQRDIVELKIPIPSIQVQQWIVGVLDSITYKIKLNTRMNQVLESLAHSLFHSWFVKFDPFQDGEFVDSDLGRIPKGWEVKKLCDFIKLDKGLSYKGKFLSEDGVPLINLGNIGLDKFRIEKIKNYRGDYRSRHTVKKGSIVVANTDMTYNRVILGKPIIIPEYLNSDEFIFTHHLYAIRNLSNLPNLFFYFIFHQPDYKFRVENYATGTTVLAIPKDAILDHKYVLPNVDIVDDFYNLAKPLFDKINKNAKEILFLSSLRALLLPYLLSGKLRINDPEQFLEEFNNDNE